MQLGYQMSRQSNVSNVKVGKRCMTKGIVQGRRHWNGRCGQGRTDFIKDSFLESKLLYNFKIWNRVNSVVLEEGSTSTPQPIKLWSYRMPPRNFLESFENAITAEKTWHMIFLFFFAFIPGEFLWFMADLIIITRLFWCQKAPSIKGFEDRCKNISRGDLEFGRTSSAKLPPALSMSRCWMNMFMRVAIG